MFAVYKLYGKYYELKHRTRVLQNKKRSLAQTSAAEGYELQEKSSEPSAAEVELGQQAAAIKSEWQDWTAATLVYV